MNITNNKVLEILTKVARYYLENTSHDVPDNICEMIKSEDVEIANLGLHQLAPLLKEPCNYLIEFGGSGDSGDVWEDPFKNNSNLAYDIVMDTANYDWYNNDGGDGTIEIDLKSLTVKFDFYYNELQQFSVYNEDLTLNHTL